MTAGKKEDRSYFIWLYGKPPNLVVEIVSNKEGGELDRKMDVYQSIGVSYYAVHDPFRHLGQRELRLFQLVGGKYIELMDPTVLMEEIGLGLVFWEGTYLDVEAKWLRFVDREGRLIPTGLERSTAQAEETREERARANQERTRANQERARADEERARADQAEERARRLEERLRQLEEG